MPGAGVLGGVQRDVGAPEHLLRRGRPVQRGDADAGGRDDLGAAEWHRLVDHRLQPERESVGRRHVGVGEQHRELVAAEPRHQAWCLVGQPLAGDGQQLVARGVAQGVVDVPEVVEVEHQHHASAPGTDGVLDCGVHGPAVGHAGQLVVQSLVGALRGDGVEPLHSACLVQRDGGVRCHRLEDVTVGGGERLLLEGAVEDHQHSADLSVVDEWHRHAVTRQGSVDPAQPALLRREEHRLAPERGLPPAVAWLGPGCDIGAEGALGPGPGPGRPVSGCDRHQP